MSISDNRSKIKIEIDGEILELMTGESIFTMLLRQEKELLSFCGGRGSCGRCRVQFLENPTMPSSLDRKFLTPEELRGGMRLACQSRPKADCKVRLAFLQKKDSEIVTEYHNRYQEQGEQCPEGNFIAIDLGTTTIAMQLLSIASGEVLGEYRAMNPQRKFGADVVSRMEASNQGYRIQLQSLVQEELLRGITSLTLERKILIVLAGNTVMEHLLLGYDVQGLSRAPFKPVNILQNTMELEGFHIVIMPCISAFVGADITAGLLAVDFQDTDKTNLFLDLGTNGEMAIGNREYVLCTATAAGPAFEGGITAQIQGTDMIALTAELLEQGLIDTTGLMPEPYFTKGINMQTTDSVDNIVIKQQDIRALQMAKAAVFAGIQILLEKWDISYDEIDKVYLAGGFGYYLKVECAGRIGLFPQELERKVISVGNTSLFGAYLYGKNQVMQKAAGQSFDIRINHMLACTESINLAEQAGFGDIYLSALNFPNRLV